MEKLNKLKESFGLPNLIISGFLIVLFLLTGPAGIRIDKSITDILFRFGINSIMVLSMVPMIQSGCGLNFGIPVGFISGLLGSVLSLELGIGGIAGLFVAMIIGALFGLLFGFFYGELLNRVKGEEMVIATYVGYVIIFFFNILWVILPFKNPRSIQSYGGSGLRQTISLEGVWKALSDPVTVDPLSARPDALPVIRINNYLQIPIGMLLVFIIMAALVWFFFKTKMGTAMTAVGSNPDYARAAGISINKMRTTSVMFSTAIAAVGLITYQQSFGFIEMYGAPLGFVFPTVAAVLMGGASVNKATITNVVVGTLLFQALVTMTPSVINSLIKIDLSEIIRVVVTNGLIVYALTRRRKK
ncbi:ABC transporter permease [Proteiniclasticum sp. QWL-01]|uniref:ABC transporter permease subunit n=1 Tax=Proteiniclasticum sp. QWL-01 TaxID=3036945 RepID=UPI00220E7D69|nr:ABC transporter permease [Proteiniclasticum sp. QWL-01]UUM11181.1 ABC transporter permease [Clostridiaceae bacterium HFYG-1003]WFF72520.1 ABC transporter permease [Proteiniclasticum sp. QWL-01]